MFDIAWADDSFTISGYTFRLQHRTTTTTADDAFVFYKDRSQVEQFDRFFMETGFRPTRVLELGIWDGGSAAFWTEVLQLKRYAAIDVQTRGDSAYFTAWVRDRGTGRVTTHWGVGQTDEPALESILADGLDPLDLVLDDCSHQYGPTLRSFEVLFGRLRPGGWYIIEDWAWALQPEFQARDHPWGIHPPLHPVVHQLIDLHGSRPDLIPSVRVYPAFVAIERGVAPVDDGLEIAALIARRQRPWPLIGRRWARRRVGQLGRAFRPTAAAGRLSTV